MPKVPNETEQKPHEFTEEELRRLVGFFDVLIEIDQKQKELYKRFVYYNCTIKDKKCCSTKYMNEERLREQIQESIEKYYIKIIVTNKLQAKIEGHSHITKTLLEHYGFNQKLGALLFEYTRVCTDTRRT